MIRGRLLRGVAAAASSSVALLFGLAPPAQAQTGAPQWFVNITFEVLGQLSMEAAGGLLVEELQAMSRDAQSAIIQARNEIIDLSNQNELADVEGPLQVLAWDVDFLNTSYPSQKQRQDYARDASALAAVSGSKLSVMRTPEAVQAMGYVMLIAYPTAILARLSQKPLAWSIEGPTRAFKMQLDYLINRLKDSPTCPTPATGPPHYMATYECRGFGVVAKGEQRCLYLTDGDCPEFQHRYPAEDGSWGPWTNGKLDQQVLKDKVLDNSIYDTAIVAYADLLVFMDEMGIR